MKLLPLMIASLFAVAPLAHAGTVQLNLQPLYNIDGVGNIGNTTQTSLDAPNQGGNFVFMTQSLATAVLGANGNGLTDSGLYAANADHPAVQMGYGLNPDGNNVLQFAGYREVNVAMGGYYSEIDIAAMTGGGSSLLNLRLNYVDGAELQGILVPDWYTDFTTTADTYYFVDSLDRIQADLSSFENANDPALFGFRFNTDATRQLLSIDIIGEGTGSSAPRLNVFGAAAITADVPEPGSIALMLIGFSGLLAYQRKHS